MPRVLRPFLFLIAALGVALPTAAQAQVMGIRASGLVAEKISWGFEPDRTTPTMPAECYAPVTVVVSSGAKSVQGALVLEYPQDASQNARIIAPFATTPNSATPVQLLACLPHGCEWARLTLSDDDGRSTSVEFRGSIGDDPMPAIDTGCRIALVGGVEVAQSFALGQNPQAWQFGQGGNGTTNAQATPRWWEVASLTKVQTLPDAWIAYECFDAVIASEHDLLQAPAASREALHTWVRAGGRLIVQASQAGQRTFEAIPSEVASYVTLDDPLELTPGQTVWDAMRATNPSADKAMSPVKSPARLLHVTPAGAQAGWVARFGVTDDGINPPPDTGTGLVAYGPCGLGLVAIVGMNPQRVCGIDPSSLDSLWREITLPLIPHWDAAPAARSAWYGYGGSSGPDIATGASIRSALDVMTTTPSLGAGFFIAMLAAIGVLGLLIGPVGRIVLKRKAWLSFSWLAALACIAVVSVAGWLIPKVLRSGETAAARWSAVDVLCDGQGGIADAWTTSLCSVFTGRPGSAVLPAADQSHGIAGGVWWRGVSPVETYRTTGSRQSALTLLTVPGGAGQRPGLTPAAVDFGQWTYRAFLDQRAAAPDELSHVTLSLAMEDGAFTLRVRGLPRGAAIDTATVMRPETEVVLNALRGGTAGDDGATIMLRGDEERPRLRFDRFTPEEQSWNAGNQYGASTRLVAQWASLPVQRCRNTAIEQRISAGGVGVRLHITGLPLPWDDTRWRPSTTRHEVWLRAIIPAASVRGYSPEPLHQENAP